MKEFYSGERILPKKPVYYKTDEQPEVWFTTEQVWEIRGAGNLKKPLTNISTCSVYHRLIVATNTNTA